MAALATAIQAAQAAERRVALVIGNAQYQQDATVQVSEFESAPASNSAMQASLST